MLEQVHKHLISELERAGRADIVFVVSAVLFNIMVLGINSALAIGDSTKIATIAVLFFAGTIIVTVAALIAIVNGQRMCTSYHGSLMQMYKDKGVFEYYPTEGVRTGKRRTALSFTVVLSTGLLAVIIPILIRL